MSTTFRTLLVTTNGASRALLARLTDGSDIVVEDVATPDQVIASVAVRAPDLIVIDGENDLAALAQVCSLLKANPSTVLLPVLAMARSSKARLVAFEAGADEFLTQHVRREEFLVRARALLRSSALRRRVAAEQLAAEVQRGDNVRAAFRRYISPKLADQILASSDSRDASGERGQTRTQAAIMFADMRGFTSIAERLPPAVVVELLNRFFALLTDITFEYDGTVFNMAGDSLMVGYGVPTPQLDGPERAIFAAHAMLY